jgi:hypothetical protein
MELITPSEVQLPKTPRHKKRLRSGCSSIEACVANVRTFATQDIFFEAAEDPR